MPFTPKQARVWLEQKRFDFVLARYFAEDRSDKSARHVTSAEEAAAGEAAPSTRGDTYTVRTATFPDPNAPRIWPARIRSRAIRSAEQENCRQKHPTRHRRARLGLTELVHPTAGKWPQT